MRFVRLCALVYRGRHAPGIETDEYYKTAKSHVQLILRSWEKKVDSYSFIRTCMLFWYEFGYNAATPELDYIKKVRPYAKDDPVFDEGLVKFIGYRYQVFGKQDILNEACKLAKRPRAVYTNARISGFAIMTVAFFNKDKKLLDESLGLLRKYRSGMQTTDPDEKKKMDNYIQTIERIGNGWK